MSVNDVREKLQKLSAMYPRDLRIMRSPQEVDDIDIGNADMHFFDNGDTQITSTLEAALTAGKQAAIQGAGGNQVLVLTPKRGSKLFR